MIATGVRAGALLLAGAGIAAAGLCDVNFGEGDGSDDDDCGSGAAAIGVVSFGAAVVLGLYDWSDAPKAARRANRRAAAAKQRRQLALTPLVDPRRASYGLALGGTF